MEIEWYKQKMDKSHGPLTHLPSYPMMHSTLEERSPRSQAIRGRPKCVKVSSTCVNRRCHYSPIEPWLGLVHFWGKGRSIGKKEGPLTFFFSLRLGLFTLPVLGIGSPPTSSKSEPTACFKGRPDCLFRAPFMPLPSLGPSDDLDG